MKAKAIFLTILLFLLFKICSGQKEDKIISIDWENLDESIKDDKLLFAVPFGKFHAFRIKNINRFLFQVTIEGNNIELETPVPTELQRLFRLSPTELASTAESDKIDESVNDAENEVSNLTPELSTLIVNDYKAFSLDALGKSVNNQRDKNALEKKSEELKEKLSDFSEKAQNYLVKVKNASDELFKLKLLKVNLVNLALKDIAWKEMSKFTNQERFIPIEPKNSHDILQKEFEELTRLYNDIIKLNENNTIDELKSAHEKLKIAFNTLDEEGLLLLYSEVDFLYKELRNEKNFEIISSPVQARGDFVNYNITITPLQTHSLGAYKNPAVIDFDVPVKGGLKVDFSVGPIFSFGSNAEDEIFFTEKGENANIVVLQQRENNNVISPGLGALMHFYPRTGSGVAFGGMFGVGAGFQGVSDVNLSFYTGFSFVLGKSQKVMVSGGVGFLNVEGLKNDEFTVGSEYTSLDFDLSEVTEKTIKSSLFLSLSYNLTHRVDR